MLLRFFFLFFFAHDLCDNLMFHLVDFKFLTKKKKRVNCRKKDRIKKTKNSSG